MTEQVATNSTLNGVPPLYPSRFPLWYALSVFSAISLVAHTTKSDAKEWDAEEKWVLCVVVMSLVLSCIACLANIISRNNFVGMPIEGLLLFTEAGLWLGGLIAMMDTDNRMAVNSRGGILNANLFFFSWASFITTIAIFIGYGQETSKVNLIANASPKAAYWAGICVSSLVVLASSAQIFAKGVTILGQIFDCQDGSDHSTLYCERLNFSMSLGVISAALSGFCCILSSKISASTHASGSILSLFAWVFGVGFTTFGEKSPGNGVGNLFFGCWSSFILSLFMVSSSIKDYIVEVEEKKSGRKEQEEDNAFDTDNSDAEKVGAASMNAEEEDVETASPSEAPLSPEKSTNDPAEQDTPQKSNVEVPAEESSQKAEEIDRKV